MNSWTKEEALSELSALIAELDSLREVERFSAPHARWLLRTSSFLDEVFGPASLYSGNLGSLPWAETGPLVTAWHGGSQPFEAHHQRAYLRQLETAKGILQAASDELNRKSIETVYNAKDTGPEASLILKVIRLAEEKLRKTIREPPELEVTIQDAFESLLIGADIAYSRESDAIEYSSKTYKPDFTLPRIDLAVELKLCAKPEHEKALIAQINDDIAAYKTKYGNVLFVVYDRGVIRDVQRFSAHLEAHDGILVRVVKQ